MTSQKEDKNIIIIHQYNRAYIATRESVCVYIRVPRVSSRVPGARGSSVVAVLTSAEVTSHSAARSDSNYDSTPTSRLKTKIRQIFIPLS